jgi:hypothetical protein
MNKMRKKPESETRVKKKKIIECRSFSRFPSLSAEREGTESQIDSSRCTQEH